MAATEAANQSEINASLSSRITRVDQRLDPRKGVTVYRKTGRKPDSKKQAERFEENKPILFVRRQLGLGNHVIGINIDIKSKKLVDLLKEMYDEIEPHGLAITRKPPSCSNRLFFLSREDFATRRMRENAKEGNADKELIHDLDVALKYIEEDYTPTIRDLEALLWKVPASITFDLLWTLFCPGSLLYAYDEYTEQDLILKTRSFRLQSRSTRNIVQHATVGQHVTVGQYGAVGQYATVGQYVTIEAFTITDDGKAFGFCTIERHIQQFDGIRRVHDLPVYPLKYHPKETELREKALRRGHRLLTLRPRRYMETCGFAVYINPTAPPTLSRPGYPDPKDSGHYRLDTYGRVMIDPTSYRLRQSGPGLTSVNRTVTTPLDTSKLTDEHYMLCSPIVAGFSFTTKRWGGFPLDRLVDVEWSPRPFDSLVLDDELKKMVLSMVKQHRAGVSEFDDVIRGKGKGLVGLLSGPPGCGKTLTAEAVAEATQSPLYYLSAGELGTTSPDSGESNLKRVLDLAQRWKAVVLLDEADVFLAKRTNANVARNALVSIFLRNLEYYQGILILTSNLITHCDPAFESRIHFTICYPSLSMELRERIWKNLISHTSGKDTITQRDIKALAKVPMNGRQIRNNISVAQSFAAGEQRPLSTSHIDMVMKMGRDWETAKATCGTPPSHDPLQLTTYFVTATILGFSVGLAVAVALAVMLQHRLQ
ncbi:hypothetical protein EST38_g5393 [Candolleomyces aberdarensis]|uniref:AAA+ ATPase domain-containing protein n=1 Tax=Candolleomyces aberdarensis TaxID=2316362 RepID=A0A4Q2DKN2_9AGAR|nr:hypothetical protein EST38_g5393 [Candolleomyces aberdarensis]